MITIFHGVLRLAGLSILALAVVLMAGCGGKALDEAKIARQVFEAAKNINTYSFKAEWNLTAGSEGAPKEDWQSLNLNATGKFSSPDKIQVSFGLESKWVGEAMDFNEVIYGGEDLFGKAAGSEKWETPSDLAALSSVRVIPSLGEVIAWLRDIKDVEKLPEETINGVKTLHFKGELPPPFTDRPMATRESGSLEVWIGKDDYLVRRAKYKVTSVQTYPKFFEQATQFLERDADIHFFEYNSPVDIKAPEA